MPLFEADDSDAPVGGVVPVDSMTGKDAEDTTLLRGMSQKAESYIRSCS
jgi:hypothetical protein